ncbi:heparinase II/III family protein, partial [Oceanispirochaeta sp.]|uniref:heparinase II/III domain-containing protein n=1 Tax=Oceanispirochaeta sp. TaxID=2035350 RepID=UPI0026278D87
MLQEKLVKVPDSLKSFDLETYLPSLKSFEFWERLPNDQKAEFVRQGQEAMKEGIPSLPASLFMDFRRTGNRVHFEIPYFKRRILLLRMVKAYCAGDRHPDILDGIIDLLSVICDEWSWVLPAHNWPNENALPPVQPPRVDLFAANTASLMALTVHLLNIPLLKEADRLILRVYQECRRRCIQPYMENNQHWWMGFEKVGNHGELNNWTPWITDNFLHTLFLLHPSEEEMQRGTKRAVQILNHYLNVLQPDGGCDEGPSYWDHAIGSLFGCLDILEFLTGSSLSLMEDPFLKKAASYLHRIHVEGNYFANFADCPGRLDHMPTGLIIRMGRILQDESLIQLGGELGQIEVPGQDSPVEAFSTHRDIRNLMFVFLSEDLLIPREAKAGRDVFPDSQIYIKRTDSLSFACKGGHNHESHNHNDVGQFVLYAGGLPLLIDPGVGDYTRDTFNENRYTIWSMQSSWHNLPVVNGVEQKEGLEYRASSFE